MGQHAHQGVRMKRAAAKAAARRERKQRIREMRYAFNDDPADPAGPDYYPDDRPITPRPRPYSGVIALRNMEALREKMPPPDATEKPPDNLRSKSWKYMNTCFGVMAVVMIGVGVLVGVTEHWASSNGGMAGIALICAGGGIIASLILIAYIRLRHDKMKEKRRELKKQKQADAEKGEGGVKGVKERPKTAPVVEGVPSNTTRPASSRQGRRKKRPKTAGSKADVDDDIASSAIETSDKKVIIPRSQSRSSSSLQGSINMSAIPEDQEEEPGTAPPNAAVEDERVATPPGTVED